MMLQRPLFRTLSAKSDEGRRFRSPAFISRAMASPTRSEAGSGYLFANTKEGSSGRLSGSLGRGLDASVMLSVQGLFKGIGRHRRMGGREAGLVGGDVKFQEVR